MIFVDLRTLAIVAIYAAQFLNTIHAKHHKSPPNVPVGFLPDHDHICFIDFCTKNTDESVRMATASRQKLRFTPDPGNESAKRVMQECENNGVLNALTPWHANPCAEGSWWGYWYADGCPPCASLNQPQEPEPAYLKPHRRWDPVDKQWKTEYFPPGTIAKTVFVTKIS